MGVHSTFLCTLCGFVRFLLSSIFVQKFSSAIDVFWYGAVYLVVGKCGFVMNKNLSDFLRKNMYAYSK